MINLCYYDNPDPILKGFFFQIFLTTLETKISSTKDIIIIPWYMQFANPAHFRIFTDRSLDLEFLKQIELSNIFLIDFNNYPSKFLHQIINIKGKKSEIIGIQNYYDSDDYLNIILELDEYKNKYSLLEIKLIMGLKYNLSPEVINEYEKTIYMLKNSKIKIINDINDICKFIKNE